MTKSRYPAYLLFAFTSILFLDGACVNHEFPEYKCPDDPVSYSEDVEQIIVAKCATTGCHNGDGNPNGPGVGRNWLDFDLLQPNAKNGKIKSVVVNHIMPPSSEPQLSPSEIAAIACWVDQGANEN